MAATMKGAISFGLLHVPIALHTATQDNDIHFNQLCRQDGSRVKYRKVCAKCGKEVSPQDIVKGFEIEPGRYVTLTDEDFESMIDINLTGPFKCTREVAKVMKQTGGCIINTSSLVGTYASRMQTAYVASKFGINGLTKACARELGPYGIRVNAVAPGVVQTDMVAQSVDGQMLAALKGMTPLGRVAQPDELAGAYVYLASDAASFTTGAILAVDGGIVM